MSATIHDTIFEQLGGGKFIAITGAKMFMSLERGLSFRLPVRFSIRKINHVQIILNKEDTYDLVFSRVVGGMNLRCSTISQRFGVYAEHLRRVFSEETHLYTSL